MSLEEEDQFWNTSDVKAFNFDDEDQPNTANLTAKSKHGAGSPTEVHSPGTSGVKTLGSVLAAKSSSNDPFLVPSLILCKDVNIEKLIEFLDKHSHDPMLTKQKQDPKSYIRDVVDKKVPIDFSPYKSKTEKLLLLDCAILSSDGNTITAVTVFMSKTLKESLFYEELARRPIAIDHYVNYLQTTGRVAELENIKMKLPNRP